MCLIVAPSVNGPVDVLNEILNSLSAIGSAILSPTYISNVSVNPVGTVHYNSTNGVEESVSLLIDVKSVIVPKFLGLAKFVFGTV